MSISRKITTKVLNPRSASRNSLPYLFFLPFTHSRPQPRNLPHFRALLLADRSHISLKMGILSGHGIFYPPRSSCNPKGTQPLPLSHFVIGFKVHKWLRYPEIETFLMPTTLASYLSTFLRQYIHISFPHTSNFGRTSRRRLPVVHKWKRVVFASLDEEELLSILLRLSLTHDSVCRTNI